MEHGDNDERQRKNKTLIEVTISESNRIRPHSPVFHRSIAATSRPSARVYVQKASLELH